MLASFLGFFWPPTNLGHFLPYKGWQKVNIFGTTYPPPLVNVVCERLLKWAMRNGKELFKPLQMGNFPHTFFPVKEYFCLKSVGNHLPHNLCEWTMETGIFLQQILLISFHYPNRNDQSTLHGTCTNVWWTVEPRGPGKARSRQSCSGAPWWWIIQVSSVPWRRWIIQFRAELS